VASTAEVKFPTPQRRRTDVRQHCKQWQLNQYSGGSRTGLLGFESRQGC
jgi:hypothetical protein